MEPACLYVVGTNSVRHVSVTACAVACSSSASPRAPRREEGGCVCFGPLVSVGWQTGGSFRVSQSTIGRETTLHCCDRGLRHTDTCVPTAVRNKLRRMRVYQRLRRRKTAGDTFCCRSVPDVHAPFRPLFLGTRPLATASDWLTARCAFLNRRRATGSRVAISCTDACSFGSLLLRISKNTRIVPMQRSARDLLACWHQFGNASLHSRHLFAAA